MSKLNDGDVTITLDERLTLVEAMRAFEELVGITNTENQYQELITSVSKILFYGKKP